MVHRISGRLDLHPLFHPRRLSSGKIQILEGASSCLVASLTPAARPSRYSQQWYMKNPSLPIEDWQFAYPLVEGSQQPSTIHHPNARDVSIGTIPPFCASVDGYGHYHPLPPPPNNELPLSLRESTPATACCLLPTPISNCEEAIGNQVQPTFCIQ